MSFACPFCDRWHGNWRKLYDINTPLSISILHPLKQLNEPFFLSELINCQSKLYIKTENYYQLNPLISSYHVHNSKYPRACRSFVFTNSWSRKQHWWPCKIIPSLKHTVVTCTKFERQKKQNLKHDHPKHVFLTPMV